jgi:hypothetical protein
MHISAAVLNSFSSVLNFADKLLNSATDSGDFLRFFFFHGIKLEEIQGIVS